MNWCEITIVPSGTAQVLDTAEWYNWIITPCRISYCEPIKLPEERIKNTFDHFGKRKTKGKVARW
jgi:hypothetical protein